jgi:hypothetical protein
MTAPVPSVRPVEAPSSPPPADRAVSASADAAAPAASVSSSGLLMSRLQRLAQQDPTQLTAIASQASQTLRAAAGASAGDTARSLNRLADGFAQAAVTGDVSNLQLGPATRSHHGHHAGLAAKSYARDSGSSGVPQSAAAKLEAISIQVEQALGLSPPPLGPWGDQ